MTDPRPDLKYDSKEWNILLGALEKHSPSKEFTGILHGFRCGGLRLHKGRRGYALRPDLGPVATGYTWETKEQYIQDRNKYLMPWADAIVKILKALELEVGSVENETK